jgi:hypothetical protein
MKHKYQSPCIEEAYLNLLSLLAESTDGNLEDMPGDFVFDD